MVVVNLNKCRKAKATAEAKAQADANSVKFGRSKAEQLAEAKAAHKVRREWEGKEMDVVSCKGPKLGD